MTVSCDALLGMRLVLVHADHIWTVQPRALDSPITIIKG